MIAPARFIIDFISVIPGYIDCGMVNQNSGDVDKTKVIRATKMARAGRIIRLLRIFPFRQCFSFAIELLWQRLDIVRFAVA